MRDSEACFYMFLQKNWLTSQLLTLDSIDDCDWCKKVLERGELGRYEEVWVLVPLTRSACPIRDAGLGGTFVFSSHSWRGCEIGRVLAALWFGFWRRAGAVALAPIRSKA